MAFKHIKHLFNASGVSETLYTVPSGKEFVLLRKRARYLSSSGNASGQVSFASNNNTLETINISNSNNIVNGAITKSVFLSGAAITGTSTISDAMAELMGLEFNAGVWPPLGGESNSSSSSGGGNNSDSIVASNATGFYQSNGFNGEWQKDATRTHTLSNGLTYPTYRKMINGVYAYLVAFEEEVGPDEYDVKWYIATNENNIFNDYAINDGDLGFAYYPPSYCFSGIDVAQTPVGLTFYAATDSSSEYMDSLQGNPPSFQ